MTDWCVLVPQKALTRAKGRLELDPRSRRSLATAMLRDTVAAVRATMGVTRLLVLWDDPADAAALTSAEALGTTGRCLNEALEDGAQHARRTSPGAGIAVVPGDLPALDPAELARCLAVAAGHDRAFLPDADGTGTTVLTAGPGVDLAPRYGRSSTLAHAASGAHLIDPTALPSVRADVDDVGSLARAVDLGCGEHTLAACAAAGLLPELVP
jgi:2-phospho-L-lactate guanylyltransferase